MSNTAPTFRVGGKVLTDFGGFETGYAIALQADGKLVMGGTSHDGNVVVARYNADGSLDATFDSDGKVRTALGLYPEGKDVILQADGKILLAGSSGSDFALVRYNTDGTLDTAFDGDGKLTTDFNGGLDFGQAIALQADGKIIVAGGATAGSATAFALARYNAGGGLDTSFDGDGKVTTPFGASDSDRAMSVLVQPDGKLLVAGAVDFGNLGVVRYNANGSLDATFSGDGMLDVGFRHSNGAVGHNITLQSDGRILVAGWTAAGDFALARYDVNGNADATFDSDGTVTTDFGVGSFDNAYAIAVQADGKILLAGSASGDFGLVRYNTDGSLDTTFGIGGKVKTHIKSQDEPFDILIQPDGKIVLAGWWYAGDSGDFALARYNADGSLDTGFGPQINTLNSGRVLTENGDPVVLDTDVRVVDTELAALGHYAGASLMLARNGGANPYDVFSATGALGALVQGGALVYSGVAVGTITTNSAGTLLLTFNSSATQSRLEGVLQAIAYANASEVPPASAQIDWTFSDGNGGTQGPGGPMAVTGSTVVTINPVNDAPVFSMLNGTPTFTEDGAPVVLDSDVHVFDAELAAQGHYGGASLQLPSGNQLYSATGLLGALTEGSSLVYDGVTVGTVSANNELYGLRLSFDSNATQARVDGVLQSIAWPSNAESSPGTAHFGWFFSDGNSGAQGPNGPREGVGFSTVALQAINDAPTLSVGGTFTTDFGGNESATAMAFQPDGKIIVAGTGIVRYNQDGSLDASFGNAGRVTSPFPVPSGMADIVLLPGGKFLVTGSVAAGNGGDFAVTRYNADGTLDSSFDDDGRVTTALSTTSEESCSIVVQSDGKILVAGTGPGAPGAGRDFTVVRYNADGSLDPTFSGDGRLTTDFEGGSEDYAWTMALQADGKILVAGSSSSPPYSGLEFAIARYNANGELDTSFGGDGEIVPDLPGAHEAFSMAVQADGRIVLAGSQFGLARFNPDGSLDTGFSGDGAVASAFGNWAIARSVQIQADGRIVAAGTYYDGQSRFALVRYNPDGSPDSSFGGDGSITTDFGRLNDATVSDMLLQTDGKILVAGGIEFILGTSDFALARYNADGTLDQTFGAPVYVEGGAPVVLSGTAHVFDPELSQASGYYAGTSLTLSRGGGANAQDVFSASGNLGALIQGGALLYRGYAIGTVTTNSGGTLVLTFNSDASQITVESAMRSIAYSNSSGTPPASAEIGWVFSDGNSGAQGSGGPLSAAATSTVRVVPADFWSQLIHGQTVGPVDPGAYVLRFDDASISAASVSVAPNSSNTTTAFSHGGKSITLQTSERSLVAANTVFADGSRLVIGDNTSAVTQDDAANTLLGGAGKDHLIGLGGDDTLIGGAGADRLDGGDGLDRAGYQYAGSGVLASLATPSQNTGEAAGDSYVSIEGIAGSMFGDTLIGNAGANELLGLDGDDQLIGGAGADVLKGGTGFDFASYSNATAGVTARLGFTSVNTGDALGDTYTSIEGLIGSTLNDELFGDDNANELQGSDGADYLYGLGGADTLRGGAGTDHLYGGAGADTLDGGADFDWARYDNAAAGVTADLSRLVAGVGDAAGDFFLSVEGILGSSFADQLYGDSNANKLQGRDGNDTLRGRGGDDTLYGGAGADVHDGGEGFDFASYSTAAAGVTARLGFPSVNTGDALGDTYTAIEGLIGTNLNDQLYGDDGANELQGLDGVDYLYGLGGADTLRAGAGSDHLYGGVGADVLDGGADFDWARYDNAASGVTADLGGVIAGAGDAAGDSFVSIEGVLGSSFADQLYGNTGANKLQGRDGNDTLRGGGGDDTLYGGAGADLHDGGAGFDIASYSTAAAGVTVDLRELIAGTGDAAGDRFVLVEGLVGSTFADVMYGDAQGNELQGGDGDDRIDGGAGGDVLYGNGGNDVFVFKAGESNGDRIVDFDGGGTLARDELIFQGYGANATFIQTGANTWNINYASGSEMLTFANSASIQSSDYTFV